VVNVEHEKQVAARQSVEYVQDGMLLGLGSGSTAAFAIRLIGHRVREGLQVRAIATSARSEQLAREAGIPLLSSEDACRIDLTIDGADEIDPHLRLIKGGGGALLREKIVAAASAHVVIIADSSKLVTQLGRFPLPVEVLPFGWRVTSNRIAKLNGNPVLRDGPAGAPFLTDQGNYVLDCHFGLISDPQTLAVRLDEIPGLIEHGLFLDLASRVIIGSGDSFILIENRSHGVG
jgi:ribose 5-phosphate isomerase A